MNKKLLFSAAATATLMAGCYEPTGSHEIVEVGGNVFLLNKSSGEVSKINGTTMVLVEPIRESVGDALLERFKNWSKQQINPLKDVTFTLRTKYREGMMLWEVVAESFHGDLERAYNESDPTSIGQPAVIFELYDNDGFKTWTGIRINIRHGFKTVNEENEVVHLSWTGEEAMSAEVYRNSTSILASWRGFKGGS